MTAIYIAPEGDSGIENKEGESRNMVLGAVVRQQGGAATIAHNAELARNMRKKGDNSGANSGTNSGADKNAGLDVSADRGNQGNNGESQKDRKSPQPGAGTPPRACRSN
ncbi:MAG: hypothetical protein B0D96_01910 [Candidatus Sedimenticola endophacoides]|uniref:Uncharacterized protein n=1 Tax=Candidatus Sedimenticola endophacoides TaxID=2548426 RepID=A0A6N4DHN8_9GAMM|nr:MAG: hypothetical protein B0D94_03825 [Candidatus Sedimenticola endophacoides]OQX37601.1 MAG: hypothetical protein B0D96_01910 [Candidatus Sedimenticola endophacoides]OQX39132.1 MAG: hypothetical protein B0D89_11380 [Candidatus Sedimenticola endophacoides]PUD98443.1 MAG: hypothetical protein C3L24_12770 [Candidatus Sedimenticola endophacoides]PUE03148.1 MAG: hypothetical protein C3L26_00750 [Candidatus Sedimenticola endophacoides]